MRVDEAGRTRAIGGGAAGGEGLTGRAARGPGGARRLGSRRRWRRRRSRLRMLLLVLPRPAVPAEKCPLAQPGSIRNWPHAQSMHCDAAVFRFPLPAWHVLSPLPDEVLAVHAIVARAPAAVVLDRQHLELSRLAL